MKISIFLLNIGEWDRTFKILSHLGGIPKILLENGDKGITLKREGGLPIFYYFTVQLHLLCVCVCVWGGGVKFPLSHFGSSVF